MSANALQLSDLVFYFFALLAVAGAAGVAFSKNIVYSAFSLLGSLIGVAALYIFVSADLVAVVQLLVYVGGVLVLILFAIMLTGRIGQAQDSNPITSLLPGAGIFSLCTVILVYIATATPWGQLRAAGLPRLHEASMKPTSAAIGDALLTEFLLPFEVASVVLLAAMIGAVVIARKEMRVMRLNGDPQDVNS